MEFDLTISFDTAEYLNPQLYMMVDTLKDNIPKDTILHITTNRPDDDPVLEWIQNQIPTKIYKKSPFTDLKSRCQYMFHCFEVETDKPWVVKIESDMIVLRHLKEFEELLTDTLGNKKLDLVIETENRKIFDDITADRLWRIIYKAMGITKPDFKIEYRENNEWGLPLYGTGMVAVRTEHLNTINKRWVPLTKICEKWIQYNIHPNEFAFTAMTIDERWHTLLYHPRYKFNPIGHFRKGEFPSTELIDNPILPEDTVIFDYHRSQWLYDVAKANPHVMEIVMRNKEYLKGFWDLDIGEFMEKR